jgi:hypothetical protein
MATTLSTKQQGKTCDHTHATPALTSSLRTQHCTPLLVSNFYETLCTLVSATHQGVGCKGHIDCLHSLAPKLRIHLCLKPGQGLIRKLQVRLHLTQLQQKGRRRDVVVKRKGSQSRHRSSNAGTCVGSEIRCRGSLQSCRLPMLPTLGPYLCAPSLTLCSKSCTALSEPRLGRLASPIAVASFRPPPPSVRCCSCSRISLPVMKHAEPGLNCWDMRPACELTFSQSALPSLPTCIEGLVPCFCVLNVHGLHT